MRCNSYRDRTTYSHNSCVLRRLYLYLYFPSPPVLLLPPIFFFLQKSKSTKASKKGPLPVPRSCRPNATPYLTDEKGNALYERTLVRREILESDAEHQFEGTIMKIVMSLCPGDSQITERVDSGLGDYYRIAPTNRTIAKYVREKRLQFADGGYPTYSRAYR